MVTICCRLFWTDILIHKQPRRKSLGDSTNNFSCVWSAMCGFETSKQAQVNQRAAQVGRRITNAFLLSECAQFGHSVQCVKGERVPDLGHAHKLWPPDELSPWPAWTTIKCSRHCNSSEWFRKDSGLARKCYKKITFFVQFFLIKTRVLIRAQIQMPEDKISRLFPRSKFFPRR